MKKQLVKTAIVLSVLLSAIPALAVSGNSYTDTAKVLDVDPIYETVSISIPEERCWSKPYRRNHRNSRYRTNQTPSYTGTIAGGIIGGIVGNQFGHGSGKKVMTVAGSLLGLSIGHDLSQNTRYRSDDDQISHEYRGRKQHCETTTRYESRQEIVGYRVKYRYKGNQFWTRTQSHPGKRIGIQVRITPLHDGF